MLELKPMIHKFKMKDKYFCLDVNSGIIHVIDEFTDKVLDIYDGTNREAVHQAFDGVESPEEINELLDELDSLIKDEMLYAPMSEDSNWWQLKNQSLKPYALTLLTTATWLAVTALPVRAITAG